MGDYPNHNNSLVFEKSADIQRNTYSEKHIYAEAFLKFYFFKVMMGYYPALHPAPQNNFCPDQSSPLAMFMTCHVEEANQENEADKQLKGTDQKKKAWKRPEFMILAVPE